MEIYTVGSLDFMHFFPEMESTCAFGVIFVFTRNYSKREINFQFLTPHFFTHFLIIFEDMFLCYFNKPVTWKYF